jgi:hypothetical protein
MAQQQTEVLEYGDIYFFYRPKVGSEQVKVLMMSDDFSWLQPLKEERTMIAAVSIFSPNRVLPRSLSTTAIPLDQVRSASTIEQRRIRIKFH